VFTRNTLQWWKAWGTGRSQYTGPLTRREAQSPMNRNHTSICERVKHATSTWHACYRGGLDEASELVRCTRHVHALDAAVRENSLTQLLRAQAVPHVYVQVGQLLQVLQSCHCEHSSAYFHCMHLRQKWAVGVGEAPTDGHLKAADAYKVYQVISANSCFLPLVRAAGEGLQVSPRRTEVRQLCPRSC
jgi:hypothetical protein